MTSSAISTGIVWMLSGLKGPPWINGSWELGVMGGEGITRIFSEI